MDIYETYIRTADGETFHPETIREGLEHFLGDNGYRISFNIDGVVLTLRRDILVVGDMRYLDSQIGSLSQNCAITIRNL